MANAKEKKRMIVTLTYEAEYDDRLPIEEIHEWVGYRADKHKVLTCYDDEDHEYDYYMNLHEVQTSIENRTMITTNIEKEG